MSPCIANEIPQNRCTCRLINISMMKLVLKSKEVRKGESVRGVHDSASQEFTAITQEQLEDNNATQKWPKTSVGVRRIDKWMHNEKFVIEK